MSALAIEIDLTKGIPSRIASGYILNAPYSGKSVSMMLPKGRYGLECWGAQGGYRNIEDNGGKGGYSRGIITISEPTQIYIYAGGSGNSANTSDAVNPGGFNGGGKRAYCSGGGGASDIRIGSDSLYARVIVAGGGGSDGGANYRGGYGGGGTGETINGSAGYGEGGYGGSITGNSGGDAWEASSQSETASSQQDCYSGFGFGGNGVYANTGYGGAGGGGWYGGTGTIADSSGDDDNGGGGGSGYIYTSDTAVYYPSGCFLDSSMYLSDATTIAGNEMFDSPDGEQERGHFGNGYVRIYVLETESKPGTRFYLKINGSWRVVA